MSNVEVENTYVKMQELMTFATNIKMHFKRCTNNLIFNLSQLSLAYFIICITALQHVNSNYLLLGYIVLIIAVKTMHCLFYHYDEQVRVRILAMNTLYAERKLDELAGGIVDDIQIINRYVILTFAIQAVYFVVMTVALVSLLTAIVF